MPTLFALEHLDNSSSYLWRSPHTFKFLECLFDAIEIVSHKPLHGLSLIYFQQFVTEIMILKEDTNGLLATSHCLHPILATLSHLENTSLHRIQVVIRFSSALENTQAFPTNVGSTPAGHAVAAFNFFDHDSASRAPLVTLGSGKLFI